jgi:hypothetical protein
MRTRFALLTQIPFVRRIPIPSAIQRGAYAMHEQVTQPCNVSLVVTDLDMADGFAVKFAVQEDGNVAFNAALH